MFSKKTLYGLQAVILLARSQESCPVLINDLALQGNIPKKFLEAILLELRKSGVLNSKKGKGGGYVLAKPAESITVGDIVRTLEGSLGNIDLNTNDQLEIFVIMKEVVNAMSNVLDKTTIKNVIERSSAGERILNFEI